MSSDNEKPAPAAELSLEDFIRQYKGRGKCWVCQSSHRKALEKVFRERGAGSLVPMARWLQAHGEGECESRLRHHFMRMRHHEKQEET